VYCTLLIVNDINDFTMKSIPNPSISTLRHAGPSLLVLTIVYVALLFAGGSKISAAFKVPRDTAENAVAYVAKVSGAIRWGSFWELGSAIVLGVFMAATVSRLRFHKVRAAGEEIALLGGVGATMMLASSALASWSLTRPGIAEATGAVRALQALTFNGGGPGFVVPLGLFVAGISIPAGIRRLIPQWLMWLGLFTAVACELSALTLIDFRAGYLIPVGRFVSIVWMLGISLKLSPRAAAVE
jgi:hypothetical protein